MIEREKEKPCAFGSVSIRNGSQSGAGQNANISGREEVLATKNNMFRLC